VTIRAVAELLANGISAVEDALLDTVGPHLPAGPYTAALLDLQLRLTRPGDAHDYFAKDQVDLWGVDAFWGLPHNPGTEYYRALDTAITTSTALYQFVVPMHPRGWLDEARVQRYGERIVAGEHPTALALTVLDAKQPADVKGNKAITEHWALAHYLLDGHHKAYAAVTNRRPLRVLSLIAREQGISTGEQLETVLDRLGQAAAQQGLAADGRLPGAEK
jgi:hypothetical protein